MHSTILGAILTRFSCRERPPNLPHDTASSHPSTPQPGPNPAANDIETPPPTTTVVVPTAERDKTTLWLLQGLGSLGSPLAPPAATLVSTNYAGMTPLERFVVETLGWTVVPANTDNNHHMGDGGHDVGEAPGCWSCRATAGSSSS